MLHSLRHATWTTHPFLLTPKSNIIYIVKFIVHFLVVMLLLCCGALVLARLEEPVYKETDGGTDPQRGENEDKNTNVIDNETSFWIFMQNSYNVSVNISHRERFLKNVTEYVDKKVGPF